MQQALEIVHLVVIVTIVFVLALMFLLGLTESYLPMWLRLGSMLLTPLAILLWLVLQGAHTEVSAQTSPNVEVRRGPAWEGEAK